MNRIIIFLLSCCCILNSWAQSAGVWKNKSCAVALTYDDALHVHLDKAIPQLDSLNLKGTFYLSAYMPGSKTRLADWRKAAANGHELANHTLFHPCMGNLPGREWVSKERKLENYSLERMLEEIRMTNVFLEAIDGKTKRTFAYPCGDMTAGGVSYVEEIKKDFIAARGVRNDFVSFHTTDFYNIDAVGINGQTGVQLIALVKEAMKNKKLLVFLFHGVGGEHGLNVDLKAHRELLQFLKANEKEVWIAPFIEVAEFMKAPTAKGQTTQ
jgi:peptidoglycan/xylan/chitin deacetylase (PgdA/CDA1 family)